MAEAPQTGTIPALRAAHLVGATQVARDAEVRQSPNGVRFATFGETGLANVDLDRILEAVPAGIVAALNANTYYFVPLALRENAEATRKPETAMVASDYTDEFSDSAICHRNVELGSGKRGVFISTRLLADRFALSFEFFINVAHAFVDQAGVPEAFAELVWKQAVDNIRGETSLDAWESRNLAFGRPADAQPDPIATASRRPRPIPPSRSFQNTLTIAASEAGATADRLAPGSLAPGGVVVDEKERTDYIAAAFTDAVAIYLLSLALDFDYTELREREYPLLAPAALATRLRFVAELFPPNPSYEFAVRYRRRA